mgnify:CR=1 FL=1
MEATYRGAYNFEKELEKIKMHVQTFDDNIKGKTTNDSNTENVCRIHVHCRVFDWKQPPNKNNGSSGTGTGFVINHPIFNTEDDTIYILTAHHVISNAIQVSVKFTKLSSEDIKATIVGCNPEMDVSIISIKHKDIKNKIKGFDIDNSDEINALEEVKAIGFALGKEHLQTTQGVISGRISNPSRLQTTVDVNPGNSGGPLLNSVNKIVGIVTSGLTNANGIYYAAPIEESMIIFKRMLTSTTKLEYPLTAEGSVIDYLPSLNSTFTKCNDVLLKSFDIKSEDCNFGIYCTSVHPFIEYPQSLEEAISNLSKYSDNTLSTLCIEYLKSLKEINKTFSKCNWKKLLLHEFSLKDSNQLLDFIRNNTLKQGDIVCSMKVDDNVYKIDTKMNTQFNFWSDKILFYSILDRLEVGNSIEFEIYRKNSNIHNVKVPLLKNLDIFKEMHSETENVPYLALGGVIVMPLLHNHIPLFKNNSMLSLMNNPHSSHKSMLLITHILPESPFNKTESIHAGDILVAINQKSVDTLQSLSSEWKNETKKQKSITLHMRDGSLSTANIESLNDAEEIIGKEYSSGFVKH